MRKTQTHCSNTAPVVCRVRFGAQSLRDPPPDAPKENIQVYVSRRLKHLAHVQKSFLPALDCN